MINLDEDFIQTLGNITRVEVIERGVGRYYTDYNAKSVAVSVQDQGRTLKIFVREDDN